MGLMAPQLATVEVTLNAFYGAPTLSPTSRSKNPNINLAGVRRQGFADNLSLL